MYYVTIFQIVSEIETSKYVFQEVEKRCLKSFNTYDESLEYLENIKNRNLMSNFPFAVIGEYEGTKNINMNKQEIFVYSTMSSKYTHANQKLGFAPSTLSKLHPHDDTFEQQIM